MPPGAADCHVHVLDPARFPFAENVIYRPLPSECGTASDLAATLDAAGVERVVLVNPTSGYGDDNRCMLDAIARLGARARGIARVPTTIGARSLDALMARGVVGVRVDFIDAGVGLVDDAGFRQLVAKLADRDLVLDLQGESEQWTRIAPVVAAAPVRVAIDHAGRPRPDQGVNAAGFKSLLAMAASGRVAVKLSSPMRYSLRAAPYADVDRYVSAIVREFTPERLVWGSDWPFLRSDRRLDYGPVATWLARVVPGERERRAILAATPARWFGFGR